MLSFIKKDAIIIQMITYEKIKSWLKEPENKDKVVIAAGFVLVFIVGFGSGRFERSIRRDNVKSQSNYTTQQDKKPLPVAQTETQTPVGQGVVAGAATSTLPADCPIKGNISTTGKNLYHIKGGAFYDRTKAERCFNTPAEAEAAGFVKSSR